MWWKVVIMFSAVVLYGSIGAKVGSNSVSNHPVVSDTCHHALKVQCSVMDMPPGGVECGGELDRIKADMQSKIENISVGVGVFAKNVEIKARTLSRRNQQVEVSCQGVAIDSLWWYNIVHNWFEVSLP